MPLPDPVLVPVSAELVELIPEFLTLTRRDLARARVQLEGGDLAAVRTFGHNLRGCGTSFGFSEVSRLGAEIEALASPGSESCLATRLEALEHYLSAVRVVLAEE